ncbi:hypothetical protein VTN96DRAFT_7881 [Rasamsonia emersonii]
MRLYEHNAMPVFQKMGVPMWRVAHLSDIPYVLNIPHLEGGADNSAAQLELGKTISRSIAKFASSGSPEGGGSGVEMWPAAFYDVTRQELKKDFRSKLSLQLFGGPYGTRPVTISRDMDETVTTAAEQAIQWEKLFSRCEFINSEKMREEAGV